MHLMLRGSLNILRLSLVGAVLLASTQGHADTISKQPCLDAHVQSQEARLNGKLRLAREHLTMCADPTCPSLVKDDCVPWLEEVKGQIGSVKIQAQAGGLSPREIRVILDKEGVTAGSTIEVDPGEHTLRVEASGFEPHASSVKIEPGQSRQIDVVLQASSVPSAPLPSKRSRVAPLVLGGVGLAGLGAFAYLGLKGRSDEGELKKCKPTCDPVRVDNVSTTYILADVGLGVLALGAATYKVDPCV